MSHAIRSLNSSTGMNLATSMAMKAWLQRMGVFEPGAQPRLTAQPEAAFASSLRRLESA